MLLLGLGLVGLVGVGRKFKKLIRINFKKQKAESIDPAFFIYSSNDYDLKG
jgi:hypothetical protein